MKTLHIIHLGIGHVGKTLIKQILEFNKKNKDFYLQYCGLFNSHIGIFQKKGLSENEIRNFPSEGGANPQDTIENITNPFLLIDTTASEATANYLVETLRRGAYIVLSNKKPLSDRQKQFDTLHKLGSSRLFYETTVGAGLPIIHTLKTLLGTGDKIISIEGCFSGTLGFIFSSLEDGLRFSQALNLAKEKGYTEPDPRDDLGGLDVARKALILARLMGMNLELSQIKLQKLYPLELENISVEQFMSKIPSLDKDYEERINKAQKNGKTLRYIARIAKDGCSVGLKEVSKSTDLGNLKGPDNIISFKTKRYFDNPLVIKGPGAGPQVTAAGVLGDILKIGGIL